MFTERGYSKNLTPYYKRRRCFGMNPMASIERIKLNSREVLKDADYINMHHNMNKAAKTEQTKTSYYRISHLHAMV
jgi:hypothetical protein